MSKLSSTKRVIEILKSLNDGKILNIESAAIQYETSERSIYRDIDIIKDVFGDFIHKVEGGIKATTKILLEDVLMGKNLSSLSTLLNIAHSSGMNLDLKKEDLSLIKKNQKIYSFSSKPLEDIQDKLIIKKLEKAILFRQKLEINYNDSNQIKQLSLRPYKILFLNENFYLLSAYTPVKKEGEYSMMMRISSIREIVVMKDTFYIDPMFEKFVNQVQTPFAHYFGKKEEYKEIFYVGKRVAKHFKVKSYLPSQKIIKENEDGSLEIEYTVNQPQELVELAIKWMPMVRLNKDTKLFEIVKKTLESKMKAIL